jgi:drug/metabolite transporter (DMT)-like permease
MNENTLGILSAFMSSFTWAIGITTYSKLSLRNYAPTINFSRALTTLPFFFLSMIFFNQASWTTQFQNFNLTSLLWLSFSVISSYALGDTILLIGSKYIGLPSMLTIASSYPLWTALFSIYFEGTKITKSIWLGLIFTVLGTMVVISSGNQGLQANEPKNYKKYFFGFLLAIFTSCLWACNTYGISKVGNHLNIFAMNTLRMLLALILCPVFAKILKIPAKIILSKKDYKIGVPIFILEGFLGATFFTYGLTHTDLSVAAALSSLAPVITVPIAAIMGLEKPSLLKILGIILVIIGIWFLVGFTKFLF